MTNDLIDKYNMCLEYFKSKSEETKPLYYKDINSSGIREINTNQRDVNDLIRDSDIYFSFELNEFKQDNNIYKTTNVGTDIETKMAMLKDYVINNNQYYLIYLCNIGDGANNFQDYSLEELFNNVSNDDIIFLKEKY